MRLCQAIIRASFGRNIVALVSGTHKCLAPVFPHQGGLGLVIVANDVNDTVQIEEGDDKAFEHLKARINLFHPVLTAPDEDFAAEIKEGAQHLFHRANLGRNAVNQHVHVEREARLKI